MKATDPENGDTSYEYAPFGNLGKITDPLGNQTTAAFNRRGFKESSSDPDLGNWGYTYYPTGEIHVQTDAKSVPVTYTYTIVAPRLKTRQEPEGTTTFTAGTTPAARDVGKMISVTTTAAGGPSEGYSYDDKGRLQEKRNPP